jgi:hypothetical protein
MKAPRFCTNTFPFWANDAVLVIVSRAIVANPSACAFIGFPLFNHRLETVARTKIDHNVCGARMCRIRDFFVDCNLSVSGVARRMPMPL